MSILCINCGHAVTEPICASCAINEINVLLCGQLIKKEVLGEINEDFNFLLDHIESMDYVALSSQNKSIMKCIKCKKEMHLMCFYCVTNEASQIVKDNLGDGGYIEHFNEFFDRDIYNPELTNSVIL